MKIKLISLKILTYGLICLLILVNPGIVYAQEALRAATLSDFTGDVSIMKAGGEKAIKGFKQMSLTQGDRIITGQNASATLDIDKDITLYVGENTRMLISELIASAEADSESTSLDLQTGGVWTWIKKALNINSKFEIKTPTAIMGARGTQFYTSYADNTTDVSVLSGAVSISSYTAAVNENGSVEQITLEVILENNQSITLDAKPNELIDFITEELELEKMDLFAVEIIKNILELEPETVKPEWIEEIDRIIELKKEEKNQQQETQQEEKSEPRIEYDKSGSQGSGSGDRDGPSTPTFTVSFSVDGGSAVESQTVAHNSIVTEPAAPMKADHTFGGWYKEASCDNEWNFATDIVTVNTTIYAKWISNLLPAAELRADTTQNNVDYELEIEFSDNGEWMNAITRIKVRHSELEEEGEAELAGGPEEEFPDYGIYTDEPGEYRIVLYPYNGHPFLQKAGILTVMAEAEGYEVSQVEQVLLPGDLCQESCTLSVSPELGPGSTSAATVTAMDLYLNPIQGYQFYLDIESTGEGYAVDGQEYSDASDYAVPLQNTTDMNGTVTFEITIPPGEDLSPLNKVDITVNAESSGEPVRIGSVVSFTFVPPVD